MAIQKVNCEFCGKEFYGTSRAMYCSNNCKQKAFQLKRKLNEQEEQKEVKAMEETSKDSQEGVNTDQKSGKE